MSGPPNELSTSNDRTPPTNLFADRERPLLKSPGVVRFIDSQSNRTPHAPMAALEYVRQQAQISVEDCVGIFLHDQSERWVRGLGLPAEVYLRVLSERIAVVPESWSWEIVANEFALRQTCGNIAPPPDVEEFAARFPGMRYRLETEFPERISLSDMDSTKDFGKHGAADPIMDTYITPHSDHEVTTIELDDDSSMHVLDGGYKQPQHSLLGQTHPFSLLPPSLVGKIESRLESVCFQPDDYLMRQGDPGTGLFIIESGEAEIHATDANGQSHLLGVSTGKEILGEMSLLTDEPRTADVKARGVVQARFLPARVFEEIASSYPVVSRVLTQLLADRLGQRGRDALTGKTFNEYRILKRLGRGGMAIVYQAEDVRSGQTVALKMMSHRLVYDAQALRLFQREARLIESFDHPNIVRMLGRFQAFRSFFIVMEFCCGTSLDEVLRSKGPLSEAEFRSAFAQLVQGLTYAHSRQVVHRDIKPSNVMRLSDGTIRLMDFGLANPIEDMPAGRQAIAGTPAYMAPEQLRGQVVDERADLFSLGCAAYRLLTGKPAFPQTTLARIRAAHARWEPPELLEFAPDIRDFIRGCLQRNPEERRIDYDMVARWLS